MHRITKRLSGPEVRTRLWHEVSVFTSGNPTAWSTGENLAETPLERLLRALTAEISCDALLAASARQLGADLRGKHGYITREDAYEGSADLRRGLALLAIESLHGADLSDLAGGDRLSPEQLAFYVADDFWPGRDDRPVEEWADSGAYANS